MMSNEFVTGEAMRRAGVEPTTFGSGGQRYAR